MRLCLSCNSKVQMLLQNITDPHYLNSLRKNNLQKCNPASKMQLGFIYYHNFFSFLSAIMNMSIQIICILYKSVHNLRATFETSRKSSLRAIVMHLGMQVFCRFCDSTSQTLLSHIKTYCCLYNEAKTKTVRMLKLSSTLH